METTYKFISEGKEEQVPLEEWGWIAIYKDGSYLKQFDEATGIFHQFKEIALQNLDVFAVQSLKDPQDNSKRYEIHMEEGMTPIFFYRNTTFNMLQANELKIRVVHFGYKENINGKSVKTIMAIHPSGALSIANTDGREDVEEEEVKG